MNAKDIPFALPEDTTAPTLEQRLDDLDRRVEMAAKWAWDRATGGKGHYAWELQPNRARSRLIRLMRANIAAGFPELFAPEHFKDSSNTTGKD